MRHKVSALSAVILLTCLFSLAGWAAQGQVNGEVPALQNPPRDSAPGRAFDPQGGSPLAQAVAPTLSLPAGTLVIVRTTQLLSSDHSNPGDGFTAVLDQPIVAQGWVVARRGQVAVGRVAVAQRAGRASGTSELSLELSELVLVDGQQLPVRTSLVQSSAGTSRVADAQGIGAATGIGAIIGAAAGGGEGAAIGAAAGAAAGVAGVLSTRGRPTEIYPESVLTFRLEAPVQISTQQSAQAFRPVSQQDYSNGAGNRNPPRNFPVTQDYPRYEPYCYGCYPPFGYGGYYSGYFGLGFGRRFIITGPRGAYGHGFYRRR